MINVKKDSKYTGTSSYYKEVRMIQDRIEALCNNGSNNRELICFIIKRMHGRPNSFTNNYIDELIEFDYIIEGEDGILKEKNGE